MKRLDSERQLPLSVIMGDINGLKLINDIFGHLEGDKVLKACGETLKKSCRADDIVARWGGDEFVILLPRTPLSAAKKLCRKIKEDCLLYRDKPLQTSISLGCASKISPEEDIIQVLKEAEDQMYQHKLAESRDFRRSIVTAINQTLARKSHESSLHAERLKKLCRAMGSAMGMLKVSIDELELLAALHDIGIIAIDDELLQKSLPLTPAEWEEMKRHPEVGYHIAKSAPELVHVARTYPLPPRVVGWHRLSPGPAGQGDPPALPDTGHRRRLRSDDQPAPLPPGPGPRPGHRPDPGRRRPPVRSGNRPGLFGTGGGGSQRTRHQLTGQQLKISKHLPDAADDESSAFLLKKGE